MQRILTILGFLALFIAPLNASALWFSEPGQCAADIAVEEPTAAEMSLQDAVESSWFAQAEEDCTTGDPSDASGNACFEGAEHPISTLPALIAQTQAERLVADIVGEAVGHVARLDLPLLPSPTEASVEDPSLPGVPLLARPTGPQLPKTPNSCAVYPDECESAPWIPTLNFEVSVPSALDASDILDVASLPDVDDRRGPPATGLGPSTGHERALERPPRIA